ncbi:phosphoglycerate mutase family protein [Aspergillus campestris IBT 28561]|uniref:Phosphoglycerate mutase family protein n=1 Tax=Aspergillus campestris (strain IBT 28561) TaxID=1392248 RepID=A0A2I1DH14_ASPC2|nr:phosphoglycerate mutase family protein [Aspergillus campestris IBT 28561]PKY09160.1 phosphoglycerate mutase family protein [Aspergillus campestris IBT 28561]
MPLDTIYLTRHGHRLNWTINYQTGEYKSQFPTPTGNPADPTLTSHGVRQSRELADHLVSERVVPKPFRVYSSPFYRCLQTIQPGVEALKGRMGRDGSGIDEGAVLDVRVENGVGEWFGPTSFFHHPSPSTPSTLKTHFPAILPDTDTISPQQQPNVIPSTRGETIAQLHDRLATALSSIIADVDAEVAAHEQATGSHSSKAILICSHAAPLIAIGRALTGNMPDDPDVEDFNVFTAGLSTFRRRMSSPVEGSGSGSSGRDTSSLAPGTKLTKDTITVPQWRGGRGVGGGWDCIANGDCSFLREGAERGWHFCGEESFDTGPMAPPSAFPTSGRDSSIEGSGSRTGTKL